MAARLTGPALDAALRRYLDATADDGFAWGASDCCAWAAGWVIRLTGRDPMRRWRGRYGDAATARAAMGLGGLRRAFVSGCREAGLAAVDQPAAGDVGLIETASGPAAAIRVGPMWAGKIDGGLGWTQHGALAMGLR